MRRAFLLLRSGEVKSDLGTSYSYQKNEAIDVSKLADVGNGIVD